MHSISKGTTLTYSLPYGRHVLGEHKFYSVLFFSCILFYKVEELTKIFFVQIHNCNASLNREAVGVTLDVFVCPGLNRDMLVSGSMHQGSSSLIHTVPWLQNSFAPSKVTGTTTGDVVHTSSIAIAF